MRDDDDTYSFEARIKHATSKAVLVEPTMGPEECWIPRSQIKSMVESGEGVFWFVVSEWIAKKNGLIW